jgi:hypothetical protein
MQAGVDRLWPYVDELFRTDPLEQRLVAEGIAVDASSLRDEWHKRVTSVLDEATLAAPESSWTAPGGGRRGLHTEAFGYLLRRDAAPASLAPGSALVSDLVLIDEEAVRRAAAAVPDPELPMVTIEDLGILRDVTVSPGGRVAITITPTYSGCPRWKRSRRTSGKRSKPAERRLWRCARARARLDH